MLSLRHDFAFWSYDDSRQHKAVHIPGLGFGGLCWKHNTIYCVVGSTIYCVEADEGDLLRSVDGAATAADNFPQEIYLLTTGCRGSVTGTHLDAFCWFDFYTAE